MSTAATAPEAGALQGPAEVQSATGPATTASSPEAPATPSDSGASTPDNSAQQKPATTMSRCVSVKKRDPPPGKKPIPKEDMDGRILLDHVASHSAPVPAAPVAATAPAEPPKKESPGPRKQRYQTTLEVEKDGTVPGGRRMMEAVIEFDAAGNGVITGLFGGAGQPQKAGSGPASTTPSQRVSKTGSIKEPSTPPATAGGPIMYSTSARPGSRDGARMSGSGIVPGTSVYEPGSGDGMVGGDEVIGGQQALQQLLLSPIGRNSMTLGRSCSIVKGRTMGRSNSVVRTSMTGAVGSALDSPEKAGPGRFRDIPDAATLQAEFSLSPVPMPPPGVPASPGGRASMTLGRTGSMMRSDSVSRDRGYSESGAFADTDGMFQPSLSVRIRSNMDGSAVQVLTTRRSVRASMDFMQDQGSSIFDRITCPSHTGRRSVAGQAPLLGQSTAPMPSMALPVPEPAPILSTSGRL